MLHSMYTRKHAAAPNNNFLLGEVTAEVDLQIKRAYSQAPLPPFLLPHKCNPDLILLTSLLREVAAGMNVQIKVAYSRCPPPFLLPHKCNLDLIPNCI